MTDEARFDMASAERIGRVVRYVEKQIRNESGHRGGFHAPGQVWYWGKPQANIARNSSGSVNVWSGALGSEADTGQTISNVYNNWIQTASQGKWCRISNNAYGFQIDWCCNNAADVWGTVGAQVTSGGSATVTVTRYANGDNPGATITGYPDETYTGTTIASGKQVRCEWDDKLQKYWIVGAQC